MTFWTHADSRRGDTVSGRPFLQIPGPTNVPDRILRAMDRSVIDHRGPEFGALVRGLLPDVAKVFKSEHGKVVLYPASGTGAWEATLVNTLAPGDRVLSFQNGQFSTLFADAARQLGMVVDEVPVEWGQGVPIEQVADRLRADRGSTSPYKAVLVVHNETSTGVTSNVAGVRQAIDAAGHDALLLVDAVSSLASIDFRMDEWGVDVTLTGSQKGLMLPPGMALLCVGPKALAVSDAGGSRRNFFDWRRIIADNAAGFFPYTPATLLLFGLREAIDMLDEEGLENVFARHQRLAQSVRAAVDAWGLQNLCRNPAEYSNSLTAVVMPEGKDAGEVMRIARERYDLALGVGLGRIRGKVFRIGHLGALNELEVLATLGGIEMALAEAGVPVELGTGVAAAQRSFAASRQAQATPIAAAAR
ncbi:MAG: aminotransferase class V-fold PLP-dependent enzyme [Chloroflexi bacterium]|nr:aminotransferase class V-fold PLP-dependent enzyme [Chloroflexota bacterium]